MALDLNNVETEKEFSPLDGEFTMTVEKGEVRTSKAGHDYLALAFKVTEGERSGAKAFENLNLSHPNAKARDIANSRLKALVIASGVTTMQFDNMDAITNALMGKTFKAVVIPDGDYSKVKRFIMRNGAASSMSPPVSASEIPFNKVLDNEMV